MAEVEYKGIKMSGSKLMIILPLVGTLIGGLWGVLNSTIGYLLLRRNLR